MHGSATTAAPSTAARDSSAAAAEAPGGEAKVDAAVVTINRPARDLYDYWRDFSRLAGIMENVDAIETLDSTRSRWVVKAPAGRTVEWESVVTDDEPGKLIAWQSVADAQVKNSGRIEFIDAGDRGTVVRAVVAYDPPGGTIGALIAKLFQREPAIQARRDLRRFKQFMETGEVATSSRTLAHHAEHRAG